MAEVRAAFDGGARSASVIAETDGEVSWLDFEAYESLRESHPQLAHRILPDLLGILVMRLCRLTTAVAERN